ncbi:MAG: VanW family protein [Microthrixaceae bacterium]|nr:VanW family protein [Microthrixaceae bacterium]
MHTSDPEDNPARHDPDGSGVPGTTVSELPVTATSPAVGNGGDSVPTPPPDEPGVRVQRTRPSRWPKRLAIALAIPVAAVLLIIAAWAMDTWLAGDTVARNTDLAGEPVGGMDAAQLEATVDDLATQLPDTEVVIDAGDVTLTSTAGELGLGLDAEATTSVVMDVGSTAPLWQRPFEWLGSFFTPRSAPVELSVDDAAMATTLETLEGDQRTAPVEPSLVVTDGTADLAPGVDGIELTTESVIEDLPTSLADLDSTVQVTTERTIVTPDIPDEAIAPLVDQANGMAGRTTTVRAGDQSFELEGSSILHGAAVDMSGGEPRLTISEEVIGQQIVAQQQAYTNPTDVTFVAGGGGLVPKAGHDAEVCCGEGAVELIVDGLVAGETEVVVPTRTMTAAEGVEWASTLGVNQVVSEFTTPHPCCQPRVTNIHTISDRIRGTLIAPGETFSVNDLTGRRTTEKGYVPAPAIVDGEHVQDVGGGVSQFATTLFNAAFFAGLPIPEYKMHSEYISRYPYAREATMFYPTVDLQVTNDTPYGIVIWPTYNDTSVTVQLWSTPWARGEEAGKTKTSGCGSVTTTRTTTYPDGTQASDKFRANYRCD